MSRLLAAVALAALCALSATGCGGDDESVREPSKPPELTVPRTQPERTTTAPATTTPQAGGGSGQDPATAPAPAGEGDGSSGGTRPAPDSPQNDTPPPPGSPAEQFEKDCEARKACG